MIKHSLFRAEALEHRKNAVFGTVLMNSKPSEVVLTGGIVVLMGLILLWIALAEYSEKFTVVGYLNSNKAVVGVYPRIEGVILRSWFRQGDRVNKGDKLFLIDTSYAGFSHSKPYEIDDQLQKSKLLIEKQIQYQERQVAALKQLVNKQYVSRMDYNRKQQELVELQNRKNQIEMDLLKNKQGRSYLIRSPITGTLSTVVYQQGQYAKNAKPLVKIIPEHAILQAELFVPASKSGFLKKNRRILIRYDAYPYERFGTYVATINAVSQSIMTDEEEDKPIRVGEPYYKLLAKLQKQSVSIYGEEKKIRHGMTITAVIMGSRRKIWQWILDPLYSYYGRVLG